MFKYQVYIKDSDGNEADPVYVEINEDNKEKARRKGENILIEKNEDWSEDKIDKDKTAAIRRWDIEED